MAEKSNMPYLAIVVLVAAVAVAVLVLNARPSSEEAAAGEATRSLPGVSSVVYLTSSDITPFYTTPGTEEVLAWEESKTGEEVCKEMGYRKCLATEFLEETKLYETTDGYCSGRLQLYERSYPLASCAQRGATKWPCTQPAEGSQYAAEPRTGDSSFKTTLKSVFCVK